jgi:hypothetical protein
LVHARWRLDEARRARRTKRYSAAVSAGDEAIRGMERCAFAREHLDLLVDALVERGATALLVNDPATAETVFLKAIAFSPLYELDLELYDKRAIDVFGDVRRASRELRYGSIRVDVAKTPGAAVSVDFGSAQDAPLSSNLADGRHFVSVTAPSRHEVVALVPVRAERQTSIFIRPPPSGDVRERAQALGAFRASDPKSVSELARVAGVRFVLTASIGASGIALVLDDGRSGTPVLGANGTPVLGASGTLSLDPGPDEIDALAARLTDAAAVVEPKIRSQEAKSSWYATWWGVTLIGVAAAGAAVATYFVISSGTKTQYQFGP